MMALQARVAATIQADPAVQDTTAFSGGGNNGRMFVVLKPRDQRDKMPQVMERLRKATRSIAGVNVYMAPVQNLQLGGRQSKSRYQYTLQSVSGADISHWANEFRSACATTRCSATSPATPRKGPAGHPRHRPRQGQPAGRAAGRRAHRAVRRLRRTPGVDHLLDRGQLLRDPGNGRGRRPPVRGRAVAPVVRSKTGQLVQLSSLATSSARSARSPSTTRASCRRSRCRSTWRRTRRWATPPRRSSRWAAT
jgi:hypothetical protein